MKYQRFKILFDQDYNAGFITTGYNKKMFWSYCSSIGHCEFRIKIMKIYIFLTVFKKKSLLKKI